MDGERLEVLVASTSAQRQQGLREVETLPDGIDGMLFEYELAVSATFGMLNTPMPLDIWWFDSNGALIGSAEMDPCFAEPCTDYRSPGPVTHVLETPLGEYDFAPGAILSTG